MHYIASLYSLQAKSNSFKDTVTRKCRYDYTMKRTATLLKQGEMVYSPIVHCHQMSVEYSLPKQYKFWQTIDRHMIALSEGVIVLMMKGWEDSEGMGDEIKYAESLGKEVRYLECEDYIDPYD